MRYVRFYEVQGFRALIHTSTYPKSFMPFTELVPLLKEFSHAEKLLLLHFLVAELLKESGLVPLSDGGTPASQGLHDSFEAASVLARALAE